MEEPITFYSQEQKIHGHFHLTREGAPCILCSHGLASSKDGDKWQVFPSNFNDTGYACLRFSYRGCGEGVEKSHGNFEDSTLTGRIQDYKAALDFLQQTKIDKTRIGVIGSSFGGMVALAAGNAGVKCMVILATPFSFNYPKEFKVAAINEKGFERGDAPLNNHYPSPLPKGRGTKGEGLDEYLYIQLEDSRRLKKDFFDDVAGYNFAEVVGNVHCPLLIIHGGADQVVPVKNAYQIYRNANEPKKLEIIEGANHVFDKPEHIKQVAALSLAWFGKYL